MSNRIANILTASTWLTGLYFLAVMPRMTGRADPAPFNTKFFAHRGLHDNKSGAPENSMPAFRKAVEKGYGIELDVQLSSDGVPVIFHDLDLARACGVQGLVRERTYEELQTLRLFGSEEKIPALKDFLEMVDGRVPLIVEFKSEDSDLTLCRVIAPMLRAYKGAYYRFSFLFPTSCQNLTLSLTIICMKGISPGGYAETFTRPKRPPGRSKVSRSWKKRRNLLMYSFLTALFPNCREHGIGERPTGLHTRSRIIAVQA